MLRNTPAAHWWIEPGLCAAHCLFSESWIHNSVSAVFISGILVNWFEGSFQMIFWLELGNLNFRLHLERGIGLPNTLMLTSISTSNTKRVSSNHDLCFSWTTSYSEHESIYFLLLIWSQVTVVTGHLGYWRWKGCVLSPACSMSVLVSGIEIELNFQRSPFAMFDSVRPSSKICCWLPKQSLKLTDPRQNLSMRSSWSLVQLWVLTHKIFNMERCE